MGNMITESDMDFIADNAFHIEKSPSYTNLGSDVKSVEFVRIKDNKLLFVEAKSSFPKPDVADAGKSTRFKEEIGKIYDKFTHSLNLYSAVEVGVIGGGFPADYKPADKVTLVFVMVIKGFEQTWCIPIQKALLAEISKSIIMAKIWKPEVDVINEETAKKKRLIN